MPRALIIIACVLVASLTGPSTARAQQEVRLDGARWSFTIPKGWERIPDELMKAQNDLVAARSPTKMSPYALGIRRADYIGVYALFQAFPDERMNANTFEDIERIFSTTPLEKAQETFQSSFADLIASSSFDKPRLDRDRKRVVITMRITDPSGREARGVTQGLLWAGGMLNVHAYAPAGDFEKSLPELLSLADAVAFDPGQSFEPGTRSRRSFSAVSSGIAGALGAVIAVAFFQNRQKKRRAEASQPTA